MRKIHILTTNQIKSKMYLFPLHFHEKRLRETGLTFKYFYRISPALFSSEQIIVDCNCEQDIWRGNSEEMYMFLERAKKYCNRIIWLDTTASTSVLRPATLDYVDFYYKGLILKKLDNYLKPFYSNRIFADYYHRKFGAKDSHEPQTIRITKSEHLNKLRLLWNYSLAAFFGLRARLYYKLREFIPLPYFYSLKFTPPQKERPFNISCRLNTDHRYRESISYQRKEIIRHLKENFNLDSTPVPRKKYYKEMRYAKIGISPFGGGEITYRDFEVIPCGAAMMKPDMEHLETWPSLYIKDKTYISHEWDLNDLTAKIRQCLENKKHVEIAENAQNLYHRYLYSREGHDEFLERASRIFSYKKD
jgi:hypothetical protein